MFLMDFLAKKNQHSLTLLYSCQNFYPWNRYDYVCSLLFIQAQTKTFVQERSVTNVPDINRPARYFSAVFIQLIFLASSM